MTDDPQINEGYSEIENLEADAVVARKENAVRESTLTLAKFVRLLHFRLFRQGFRITLLWLVNMLVRGITGYPHRSTSEIMPQLFVGGQYSRQGWSKMSSWGITSVVNMRKEFDDQTKGIAPARYLHLPTIDDDAPSLDQLQVGVDFIREELDSGGIVYVHCGAGVGRAATMAAAYLVSTGLDVEEAWHHIRTVRPFIRPSIVQVRMIEHFAARCRNGRP